MKLSATESEFRIPNNNPNPESPNSIHYIIAIKNGLQDVWIWGHLWKDLGTFLEPFRYPNYRAYWLLGILRVAIELYSVCVYSTPPRKPRYLSSQKIPNPRKALELIVILAILIGIILWVIVYRIILYVYTLRGTYNI